VLATESTACPQSASTALKKTPLATPFAAMVRSNPPGPTSFGRVVTTETSTMSVALAPPQDATAAARRAARCRQARVLTPDLRDG
jgi:hypothetical protein